MSWEDAIIAIGQWIFFFALIPSIMGKDKPALSTSLMTGSILVFFVAAYASIGLITSAASTALVSLGWYTLAYQKYKATRRTDEAEALQS